MESIDDIAFLQTSVCTYQQMTNQFWNQSYQNLQKYFFKSAKAAQIWILEWELIEELSYFDYKQHDISRLSFVANLPVPLKQENR